MKNSDKTQIKEWKKKAENDVWLQSRLKLCSRPNGEQGVELGLSMNEGHSELVDWGLERCAGELRPDSLAVGLDIGCGGGATLQKLHTLFPQLSLSGIDYSPDMVRLAGETTTGFAAIREGDVCALPYDKEQFTLITAVETLYFWQPLEKALAGIYSILKEGGRFIVIHEIYEDKENEKFTARNQRIRNLSEMHLFTPQELAEILQSTGFTDVRFHTLPENNWICYSADK